MYTQKPTCDDSPLMVSVCVMTYNLEKYIAEALDSILMQKVSFKYNIVVGDDQSSDNTRRILQDYSTKYPDTFKLLLHKNNLGMLPNFAETLKACNGKYLAILDGDDYWTDPLKLQKQVDFLESKKDYSMVFHNTELHDHTKSNVIIKPFNLDEQNREYTPNEIMERWSVATCSVLCINKEQYRYIENNLWFPVQDLPFYLCCASMGKIYYLAETMCVYRKLPTGSQNSEEFRSAKIHLTFIEYFKALHKDFSDILCKETIDRVSASHYLHAAHKYNNDGNEKYYQKYLALAMHQDPQLFYEREIKHSHDHIKQIVYKEINVIKQKHNKDIDEKNKELKILKNNHTLLMKGISDITKNNTWKNPFKKINAYKSMIRTYHRLKKSGNKK